MTKNLETADAVVKLILAVSIVLCYVAKVITGPFATTLFVLSIIILLIFLIQNFIRVKTKG